MNRLIILFAIVFFSSCGGSADKTETTKLDTVSTVTYTPDLSTGSKMERKEQVMMLINMAKQTMDSIDAAYSNIRSSSRLVDLSLEEREDVNEALQQLNTTKELIILETQKEVIEQLREKTFSLNSVIDHINQTSVRLNNIALTISKISNIIEKTTNVLASGLTMGIIKPKTITADNQ